MYFNWDAKVSKFLFSWWNVGTFNSWFISWLVIFVSAFGYEGLINARARLEHHMHSLQQLIKFNSDELEEQTRVIGAEEHVMARRQVDKAQHIYSCLFLSNSLFYTFNAFMSLMLMMVFMSFNVWLIGAQLLGVFLGHLVWSYLLPENVADDSLYKKPAKRGCCS